MRFYQMVVRNIRPGKCRHLLTIKKNNAPSTNLTGLGRDTSTEATHATVKGELVKLSGNERILANQEYGAATHECLFWYVPGVDNKMWIEGINGKRYNIVDVTDVEEKHRQLYLILNSETS